MQSGVPPVLAHCQARVEVEGQGYPQLQRPPQSEFPKDAFGDGGGGGGAPTPFGGSGGRLSGRY